VLSGKNERVKQKVVKVVLDTNILVSSLLTAGPPAVIVDLVADGNIIPFYSNPILQEYWEVLSRKKFGFNPAQVSRLLADIARPGIAIEGKQLHLFQNAGSFGNGSRKTVQEDSFSVKSKVDFPKTEVLENPQLNKNKKVNEDDRIFYDAAVEANAYLITGNIKHFPKESFIITPSQFLAIIGNAQ
jgi:predicted nucleic acid-binding protein